MAGKQLNAVMIFGGDASKALSAITQLNAAVNKLSSTVNKMNQGTRASTTRSVSTWQKLQGVFKTLGAGARGLVDGFRLITQGLMSAGRAMTFFISLPLAMFMKTAASSAMTFQDQMIRVGKTTGIQGEQLDKLSMSIRNMALAAPTATKEIAAMAEQAGQLGIADPDKIIEFVRWMEIMATSTNISGDDVVSTMGKISAAFGWSIDESVNEVARLANVMNKLENDTAATAGEIAKALFRFAPIANQLGIHAADAAALAAALIALGVSADSAGTRLGTMYVKMTQNADTFAELASGTEKYATEQSVLNAINEDAVEVLIDLIEMMNEQDNRARAIADSFDIVGIRGGRALGALASGNDVLVEALKAARMEWNEASSLIVEYNRQLESSSSHMQILKNNVADVGLSFTTSLLPAFNQAMELMIPGIRKLSRVFQNLEDTTKLYIIAGLALTVVLGPIIFLLSQLTFGLSMMVLGLFKAAGAIFMVIKGLVGLGAAIGSSAIWVIILVAAIIGGMALLLKALQNSGIDIATFFTDLGTRAVAWGENLAAQIANGFIAGAVRYIVAAVQWVANLIAGFFEGHSPPDVGPLSHIDKWGKTLIDTYFKGMQKADFGILKSISNTIAGIFKNLAITKLMGEKAQFKNLLQARQDMAKLLKIFRDTGKISSDVLNDVVKNLGNAADEVKKLITFELELLAINEALAALERERQQVTEDYNGQIDDIASGPGSPAERVKQIREAMRLRNDELKRIAEEERALEKQKTVAEEQLEIQKAMIDAMQKQDDIQAQLVDTLKKLAGALEDMATGFPEITPGGPALPDIDELLGEIGAPIIEFEAKIKSKEGIWDAFLASVRGELDEGLPTHVLQRMFDVSGEDAALLMRVVEIGNDLHEKYTNVKDTFDQLKDTLNSISFESVGMPEGVNTTFETLGNWWATVWPGIENALTIASGLFTGMGTAISGTLSPAFAELSSAWGEFAIAAQPVLDAIVLRLPDIWKWLKFIGKIIIGTVVSGLMILLNVFLGIATGIIKAITYIIREVMLFFTRVTDGSATMGERVMAFFQFMFAMLFGWIGQFFTGFLQYFVNLVPAIREPLENIANIVINFVAGIITEFMLMYIRVRAWVSTLIDNLIAFFVDLYHQLIGGSIIPDMLTDIYDAFVEGLTSVLTWLGEWVGSVKQRFIDFKDDVIAKFVELKDKVIDKVKQFVSDAIIEFAVFFVNSLVSFVNWKDDVIETFTAFVTDTIASFVQWLLDLDTEIADGIEVIRSNLASWGEKLTTWFEETGTSWLTQLAAGVEAGKNAVVTAFDNLVGAATSALQPLIDIIKKIVDFVKNPPKMPTIKLPKLGGGNNADPDVIDPKDKHAAGTIAMTPRTALIGEVPEAIIPLHKLPGLITRTIEKGNRDGVNLGGAGGGGDLHVHIHEGAVRNDGDIESIVEAVKNALNEDIGLLVRYGGA